MLFNRWHCSVGMHFFIFGWVQVSSELVLLLSWSGMVLSVFFFSFGFIMIHRANVIIMIFNIKKMGTFLFKIFIFTYIHL